MRKNEVQEQGCGCEIVSQYTGDGCSRRIEYCPLHAAAPAMLGTLMGIVEGFEEEAAMSLLLTEINKIIASAKGEKETS